MTIEDGINAIDRALINRADFVGVNAISVSFKCHEPELPHLGHDTTPLELYSSPNANRPAPNSRGANTRSQSNYARRKHTKRRAGFSWLVPRALAVASQASAVRLWLVWIAALSGGII